MTLALAIIFVTKRSLEDQQMNAKSSTTAPPNRQTPRVLRQSFRSKAIEFMQMAQ
jgi:hypothetical protein